MKQPARSWFAILFAEHSVANLGYFGALAVLSLYFVNVLDLPPAQAAAMMLVSSLAFRASRIVMAPALDRIPVRAAIPLSLVACSLGYVGLALTRSPLAIAASLGLVGIGYGSNSLLVRTLAAHSQGTSVPTLLRYATLSTGTNLGAAIGPIVGNAVFLRSPGGAFAFASVALAAAALISLALPRTTPAPSERPMWIEALRLHWTQPLLRRAVVLTALGWFLYAQLYAALPLFVDHALRRPELVGTFFTVNAGLVIAGSVPLTRLALSRRAGAGQLIALSFALHGLGFAVLWARPTLGAAYGAVGLWTVAEILMMPALNTMVAERTEPDHRLVAFAVNAVALGVGESLGNSVGVGLAGWLLQVGRLDQFFGALALISVPVVAVAIGYERRPLPAERPAGAAW